MFRALCTNHQEVKTVLYSIWYRHTETSEWSKITKIQFYKYEHILTYLLTPWCSPSWEANWFAASQEIPRISRNPMVHYRTHKRPPPVSILGQPSPFHIPTSHLLEVHPNIIHPSTSRSPQWSLSLRFPHQYPIRPPLLTHTSHMPTEYSSKIYVWILRVWLLYI